MKDQKKAPELLTGQSESNSGDENEGQNARIARYSKAKKQADDFRKYIENHFSEFSELEKIELEKINLKLCGCGNYLLFRNYYTVGKVRLAKAHFCKKHLMCPLCAIRRGARGLRIYLEAFLYLKAQNPALTASLVTLTVKNGPDLTERLAHLKKGIQAANQRMRDARRKKASASEFCKFLGYVGSYEVKKGKGSGLWHPHCHIIVLHDRPLDQKKLSEEWLSIMGDSFVVDISPLQHPEDPAHDFVEVFKYALKFSSMHPKEVIDAYFQLTSKRLIFNGGLMRGLKIPENLTDDLIADLPYIELMYRYTDAGYSLTEYRHQGAAERTETPEEATLAPGAVVVTGIDLRSSV